MVANQAEPSRTAPGWSSFLTKRDVAALLTISERSVEKLMQAGRIRAVRIGRRVLISRSAYERFVASLPAVCVGGAL